MCVCISLLIITLRRPSCVKKEVRMLVYYWTSLRTTWVRGSHHSILNTTHIPQCKVTRDWTHVWWIFQAHPLFSRVLRACRVVAAIFDLTFITKYISKLLAKTILILTKYMNVASILFPFLFSRGLGRFRMPLPSYFHLHLGN